MQRRKRLQTFSTMNLKSSTFNILHSRRSDCFRESKVLCGLVQALDSKVDHTLQSMGLRVGRLYKLVQSIVEPSSLNFRNAFGPTEGQQLL
ncbi:hypothetical protein TNCV_3011841 [Trichonephila clavipes]|nr:hypothetical protein TNCV_3011841 [Trichonephila clavipes]